MAKVTGPLFSMSASGTIGDAVTYGTWKGQPWARVWFTPENPQTQLQINVRKALSLCVEYWQSQDQGVKDTWETFAEGTAMSGYNQFVKRSMLEYGIQLGTDVDPLSVTIAGVPPSETWTWLPVV